MGHDQVVLDVDRDLHVVADDAGPLAAGRHRARVRVRQRDLPVGCCFDRSFHLAQVPHLLAQADEPLFQALDFGGGHVRVLPVGGVESCHVAGDRGLHLLQPALDGTLGIVLVTRVDGLELAPVDGDQRVGEQAELAA